MDNLKDYLLAKEEIDNLQQKINKIRKSMRDFEHAYGYVIQCDFCRKITFEQDTNIEKWMTYTCSNGNCCVKEMCDDCQKLSGNIPENGLLKCRHQ